MSTKKHDVPEELLSGLLANYKKPEDLIGENGLLKQLTKLLVEKALDAELTEHLGHERHEAVANASGNTRNGKSKKTLKGDFGELPIEVPRDRHGSFEPQLIPKHQTRWAGFDDKINSLYARGLTVREKEANKQHQALHSSTASLHGLANSPGSKFNRHSGSILNRRQQLYINSGYLPVSDIGIGRSYVNCGPAILILWSLASRP